MVDSTIPESSHSGHADSFGAANTPAGFSAAGASAGFGATSVSVLRAISASTLSATSASTLSATSASTLSATSASALSATSASTLSATSASTGFDVSASPIRIAVFASGTGTNARQIIRYFAEPGHRVLDRKVEIGLVVCNKPGAGVLDIAKANQIPTLVIEKEKFFRGSHYLEEFSSLGISFIVLAGFLWKIPAGLIKAFPEKILNIHPALLPAYGGKGMYGKAVHEAVVAAGEKQSGISIHYVDELYDHGNIFFQARVDLSPGETADSLAEKIHALEWQHYPEQISLWLESKLSLNP